MAGDEGTSNGIVSTVRNIVKSRFFNSLNVVKSGGTKLGIAAVLWGLGYFNCSLLWIVSGVFVSMYVAEKTKKQDASAMIVKESLSDPKEFVQIMTEVYRRSGKELPSWIYYPDVEKVEWMNKIIQKFWPFVGSFVRNLLTQKVQKTIQKSHALLSGFCFTDVDLGTIAPRVAGVKVHTDDHTRKDEVIIDMQIIYDGDCDIGVGVNILKAGIRDLRIRGLLRVELRPLIDSLPLIGAVSVAFVRDPTITFDLTELANLLDFPGFSSILRCSISDSIGAIMVLPEKYIVKLKADVDISRLRFPLPKGVIRIHVIEAENLAAKDTKIFGFGGKSDPYVKTKGVHVKVGHQHRFRTRTIESSLHPKWNETFDALVRDAEYGSITFEVLDKDDLNKDDPLGKIIISIHDVYERGIIDENIHLLDTDTGKLHLRMEWFELTADPEDLPKAEREGNSSTSLLSIYVDGADYLPENGKESLLYSPYLKIILPGMEPLKTKVIKDTSKPVWEENFPIFLTHPQDTEVVFQIDDEDDAKDLGSLVYPVKKLLEADEMMDEQSFPLHNSTDKAVLRLRLSLRIMKLKTESEVPGDSPFSVFRDSATVQDEKASSRVDDDSSSDDDGHPRQLDDLRRRLNAKKSVAGGAGDAGSDSGLGRIELAIEYQKKSLLVHVLRASNLIVCDEDDRTSDPYVRVRVNSRKKKTRVVKNDLNPVFDQTLEFEMTFEEASSSKLNVTVKNDAGFLSFEKTFMGEVMIDLTQFDLKQSTTKWFDLKLPKED